MGYLKYLLVVVLLAAIQSHAYHLEDEEENLNDLEEVASEYNEPKEEIEVSDDEDDFDSLNADAINNDPKPWGRRRTSRRRQWIKRIDRFFRKIKPCVKKCLLFKACTIKRHRWHGICYRLKGGCSCSYGK